MNEARLRFVSDLDVDRLRLTPQEILGAVETAVRAQGEGEVVLEPRVHLIPPNGGKGHFNILRGYVGPEGICGVKIVGDFVENYRLGLPSEVALVNLFDPETGVPLGVVDGTMITSARTGALTALGAKHLARPDSKVLAHVERAIIRFTEDIDRAASSVSDSPAFVEGRFVTTGAFHEVELAAGFDALSGALIRAAELSGQRVHRLLDSRFSGLPDQLTPNPGPSCGLIVVRWKEPAAGPDHRLRGRGDLEIDGDFAVLHLHTIGL